jgi:hypothetical protein
MTNEDDGQEGDEAETQISSGRPVVANKPWILSLLAAAMMAVLAGCNSGSTANVQNPQPPAQSNVTIAVQTSGLVNGSLAVNGTVSLTATLQGNSTQVGEGVGWLLTCQANAGNTNGICGTLSATFSASGAPITYTAPTSIATGSMAVEVVAFAEADQPANSVSPIVITTFDSNFAAGNYVLEAQGVEGGLPYEFAAVITLDGQGSVTGGEQTVNANGLSVTDHNLTGSYFVGGDGRGAVTINDPDTAIGTEIFTLVFLSNSQNPQALLSQAGLDGTGASATGTMALQDSSAITAVPSGSYAFVLNGISTQAQFDQFLYPIAMGGVVSISSGDVTGLGDEIYGKNKPINGASISSTSPIAAPDAFGGVTLILTAEFGYNNKPVAIQFAGYIVDATHIQLIESDNNFGWTGGIAIAQTGNGSFSAASLSGPYVFGVTGIDLSAQDFGLSPTSLTSVGVLNADGSGCKNSPCTGYTDTYLLYNNNNPQFLSGAQITGTLDGRYSVDLTGRVELSLSVTPPPPLNQPYTPVIILYLTGGQGPAPALVLEGEYEAGEDDFYPALGTGMAYPQSTAAAAVNSGEYGISYTQVNSSAENDGTAQMNANPMANATAPTGGVAGLSDSTANGASVTPAPLPFSGNFATPEASSPFAGNFFDATALQDFGMPFMVGNNTNNGFSVDYFYIDAQHGFFVETDLLNSVPPTNPATPSGQVSFGYYAAQCAVTNPPTACSAASQGDKGPRMIRK